MLTAKWIIISITNKINKFLSPEKIFDVPTVIEWNRPAWWRSVLSRFFSALSLFYLSASRGLSRANGLNWGKT